MTTMIDINYQQENKEYHIRKMVCDSNNLINKLYYQQINNITVIRDDKLCGGTKSRFVKYIIEEYSNYNKFLYRSPPYGGAQIALSWGINEYNKINKTNKEAIIFIDPDVHPYINDFEYPFVRIAKEFGAIYYNGSSKEIKNYLENNPDTMILPSGMDLPIVNKKIIKLANLISDIFGEFDEFYYACGSGTLVRAIQKSKLANKYYAICVTGGIPNNIGNAIGYKHDQLFDDIVREENKPPFNSAIHYDAKAWKYVPKNENKRIIFWNVM